MVYIIYSTNTSLGYGHKKNLAQADLKLPTYPANICNVQYIPFPNCFFFFLISSTTFLVIKY